MFDSLKYFAADKTSFLQSQSQSVEVCSVESHRGRPASLSQAGGRRPAGVRSHQGLARASQQLTRGRQGLFVMINLSHGPGVSHVVQGHQPGIPQCGLGGSQWGGSAEGESVSAITDGSRGAWWSLQHHYGRQQETSWYVVFSLDWRFLQRVLMGFSSLPPPRPPGSVHSLHDPVDLRGKYLYNKYY